MDAPTPDNLWVFAYGSLMWDPCFPVAKAQRARLCDWHRSFCMWSIHHRGTVDHPGLVLALDRAAEAVCEGLAYRVAPPDAPAALAALRERELVSSAYVERVLPLTLHDGRRVEAVTYVVDPDHAQYAAHLSLAEQARIIARATGGRGPNRDYLFSTWEHLRELGVEDPDLAWLAAEVRQNL